MDEYDAWAELRRCDRQATTLDQILENNLEQQLRFCHRLGLHGDPVRWLDSH